MKSAAFAVVLTAVVVFSCFEATICSTVSSTDNANANTTVISGTTAPPPVFGNITDNLTTETTHTTASTTESSTSRDLTSVTTQPHKGSDTTTLSLSTISMTEYTVVSSSDASVTDVTSISTTTSCPHPTGFDAASFVGGIILALGVMVILVIIVKCYQHRMNKSELQYSQF